MQSSFDGALDKLLTVDEDYGRPFSTVSNPRLVLASDGNRYVIKRDQWHPDRKSTARAMSQEVLAAILGELVGLPIASWRLIEDEGFVWYGSSYYENVAPLFDERMMLQFDNAADIHTIVSFDIWFGNLDRHRKNVLLPYIKQSLHLLAIDHGFCPLLECEHTDALQQRRRMPAFETCRKGGFHTVLYDLAAWSKAVDQIQALSDDVVDQAVLWNRHSTWSPKERERVGEFLKYRRDNLRQLIKQSADTVHIRGEQP